jgi:hypothetical protein
VRVLVHRVTVRSGDFALKQIPLADAEEAGKGFAPYRGRDGRDGRVVGNASNVTMRNRQDKLVHHRHLHSEKKTEGESRRS